MNEKLYTIKDGIAYEFDWETLYTKAITETFEECAKVCLGVASEQPRFKAGAARCASILGGAADSIYEAKP